MVHEPIAVIVDDSDHSRVAKVRGTLDVFTSPALVGRTLANLPDGVRALVVDLADVSFVDSAGVSALVRLKQTAQSRAVDVRAHFGNAKYTMHSTIVDVLRRVLPCDD